METGLKGILKDTTRFAACVKSVKDLRKSAVTYEDQVRLATAMLNKKVVQQPCGDVGPELRFLKAWTILCNIPKFQAAVSGSSMESAGTTSRSAETTSRSAADNEDEIQKRAPPDGRKKGEAAAAMQAMQAKNMKLAEVAVGLQQKQVAEMKHQNEILLFSSGLRGADSLLTKLIFELQQKHMSKELEQSLEETITEGTSNMNLLADVAKQT